MKYLFVSLLFAFTSFCFASDGSRHINRPSSHHHSPHNLYRTYGHACFYPSMANVGSSGYYAMRTETVLVAPERIERQWIEPIFVIKYDQTGKPYRIKISEGYYREIVIPARYETRIVQVWVPATIVVGGLSYIDRHISVGIGFGF